jgi:hypothetical protein
MKTTFLHWQIQVLDLILALSSFPRATFLAGSYPARTKHLQYRVLLSHTLNSHFFQDLHWDHPSEEESPCISTFKQLCIPNIVLFGFEVYLSAMFPTPVSEPLMADAK